MGSFARKLFVAFLLIEFCAAVAILLGIATIDRAQHPSVLPDAAIVALAAAVVLLPLVRLLAYREYVPYNPRADYLYVFSPACCRRISVPLEANGFAWPVVAEQWDTAVLAWTPAATWLGMFFEPRVEIRCGSASWSQSFERGVKGLRYLDLTPCKNQSLQAQSYIHLQSRHLRWKGHNAALFLFRNEVQESAQLLVVAPHPDDAEIAALGLYSHLPSFITTVCAGNAGTYDYPQFQNAQLDSPTLRAEVRVRESLVVPFLAGVEPSRCCNLCYADNSLAPMHAAREQPNFNCTEGLADRNQLRRLNFSPQRFDVARSACHWNSLVDDLCEILTSVAPSIVATPPPLLDSHSDHCFSTIALAQAARRLGRDDLRFFLYVVHPHMNESHPIGPRDSAVSLPPNFDSPMSTSGIYCQLLSPQQQCLKYLALQAMHDLRPPPLSSGRLRQAFKEIIGCTYELVTGFDRNPHCLMRRSARPNEVFIVATLREVEEMIAKFLAARQGAVRPSTLRGAG